MDGMFPESTWAPKWSPTLGGSRVLSQSLQALNDGDKYNDFSFKVATICWHSPLCANPHTGARRDLALPSPR